jgi:hypothetical protein
MDNVTSTVPTLEPKQSKFTPVLIFAGIIIIALAVWFAIRLPNTKIEPNKMSGLERIYFGANVQSTPNPKYPGLIVLDSMSKLILYQTFVLHRPDGKPDTITSIDSLSLEKQGEPKKEFKENSIYEAPKDGPRPIVTPQIIPDAAPAKTDKK